MDILTHHADAKGALQALAIRSGVHLKADKSKQPPCRFFGPPARYEVDKIQDKNDQGSQQRSKADSAEPSTFAYSKARSQLYCKGPVNWGLSFSAGDECLPANADEVDPIVRTI
jgi:hypothetical protein